MNVLFWYVEMKQLQKKMFEEKMQAERKKKNVIAKMGTPSKSGAVTERFFPSTNPNMSFLHNSTVNNTQGNVTQLENSQLHGHLSSKHSVFITRSGSQQAKGLARPHNVKQILTKQ